MNDEYWMKKTIDLAAKGRKKVKSNPLVGAMLISKKGEILAKGYHQKYGQGHAEVNCLKKINKVPQDSVLYCNLEPCFHTGKTGPCVDLLIEKEIKQLVIANTDPNPLVAGKSIKKLKKLGVQVRQKVLEKEGFLLNKGFFASMLFQKPWVTIKIAQTMDGFFALPNHESKWITSEESRIEGRKLRHELDAILVGRKTIEEDNPQLTIRNLSRNQSRNQGKSKSKKQINPLKLVIDTENKLLSSKKKYQALHENYIVFAHKKNKKENGYLQNILGKNKLQNTHKILSYLNSIKINSLLVEGGANTISYFLKENLVDEIQVFEAPFLLGHGLKVFQGVAKLKSLNSKNINFFPTELEILGTKPTKTNSKNQIDIKKVFINKKWQKFYR